MKLQLFKQNPKEETYKPESSLRQMEAMEIDRKEELEKFRLFLEGTAKEKSELPDQKELDELNKEATKGRGISLGLLGVLAAIPIAGLALGGGLTGLSSLADKARAAITGGGDSGVKPGGGGNASKLLGGIDTKDKPTSPRGRQRFPRMPKLPGRRTPGVTPKTPTTPSRPASSPVRSNAAGNQVAGRGQTARTNANRSQAPSSTSTPKRPSKFRSFKSNLETGTAFGGRGSKLQKRFHKLFSGKNPIAGFVKRIFGTQAGKKAIGGVIGKAVRRIPIIGAVIGTLLDIFLGGENVGRAIFKGVGAGMFGAMGAAIGGPFALFTGIGGMAVGEWAGGMLYDAIFRGGRAKIIPKGTDETAEEILYGKDRDRDGINPRTGLPYSESPGKSTIEPPDPEPAGQPLRSNKTTENQVFTGTGGVNQWLHGTPGRPGYDAGHAGIKNAHDHFSFNSRAAAVKAYKALKAAGYKPYEFEGYGNGVIYSHSRTGGHYGPVGGPYTPGDTTDGTAFDIPWSSYGSGPIGQSDYDKSLRAAQIVGAVDSTGTDFSGQVIPGAGDGTAAAATPNYGAGRTQQRQDQEQVQPQQQQPNIIERLTKLLGPAANEAFAAFRIFEYMADKELMDSIQLYGRDPETGLPTTERTEPRAPELFPGMESVMDMIESSPRDMNVSRLSPEAEAAMNNVLVIKNGDTIVQNGASAGGQMSEAPQVITTGTQMIIAGGDGNIRDTYRRALAIAIG